MKVLTPVQYYIWTVPLQFQRLQTNSISVYSFCESQELECDVIYLAFVTQFPTVSMIA